MRRILAAAAELQAHGDEQDWDLCFIGGLAVLRWGEIRATRDVDATVLTGFGDEQRYIDSLLGRFTGRRPDAADFASRTRVVLIRANNGVPIDVSLGALPYEQRLVARSDPYEFAPAVILRTCSAEDLVVLKVFAGRPRDWSDVEGIVTRQGSNLDRDLVRAELGPLLELKESAEDLERLDDLLERA